MFEITTTPTNRAWSPPARGDSAERRSGTHAGTATSRTAALDPQGRIAESSIVKALGWQAGRRLRLEVLSNTTVTIQADTDGVFTLARRAHLPLPAAVRRWCGLNPGDRVLLAAAPEPGLLLIHTMRALDAMVADFHTPRS